VGIVLLTRAILTHTHNATVSLAPSRRALPLAGLITVRVRLLCAATTW